MKQKKLTSSKQFDCFHRTVVNKIDDENVHIIIITKITLHLVTTDLYLRGRVTARYRSTDIIQIVTTEHVQNVTSAATQNRHSSRPNTHLRVIKCTAPMGSTNTPTRKSVKPKFHTSKVVLVRPTFALKHNTSKFPNTVRRIIIVAGIAKKINRGSVD